MSIRASRERVCLTSVCPLFNTPSEKMIQRGRDDAYACPYVMAYERKKPKATVAGARAPSPHQYSRRRLATLMDAARMRGRVGGLGMAAREHGAARCMRRPVAFRLSACASRARVRYEYRCLVCVDIVGRGSIVVLCSARVVRRANRDRLSLPSARYGSYIYCSAREKR